MQCGEDDRGCACTVQKLLTACASETRLELLARLARGDSDVSTLAAAVDLSAADVSYHLGMLREAGIVSFHRVGKRRIYSLVGEVRYDSKPNQVVMSFKSTDDSSVSLALPLTHRIIVDTEFSGTNLSENNSVTPAANGTGQVEFKCAEAPSQKDNAR